MMRMDDPLLQFESPLRQSMAQLARVDALVQAQRAWNLKEVVQTAHLLTVQAHPKARSFVGWALTSATHPDIKLLLQRYLRMCDFIDTCPAIADTQAQSDLVEKLYATDGFTLIKGSHRPEVLVVVFTTVYNNFGISNLMLFGLLRASGVSVLLLRDGTRASYLAGASGMGHDLDTCVASISRLASELQCQKILVTGYSSGGFASYYVSTKLDCAGYLGFSIVSDMRLDTTLPTDVFISKDIRNMVDPKFLVELSGLTDTNRNGVPRRVVVGANSEVDQRFADLIVGVPRLEVIKVPDCRHDTPEAMLPTGQLQAQFDWLLAQAN
jgi:hypothetical protein